MLRVPLRVVIYKKATRDRERVERGKAGRFNRNKVQVCYPVLRDRGDRKVK